jgi:hypothetical protein
MSSSHRTPIFRRDTPTTEELAAFHRDGFVALPNIFTDAGREGLLAEILSAPPVTTFLTEAERPDRDPEAPLAYFVRPWNDRQYWSDQLLDAPLVVALLQATIGPDYHFCHSALNVALRGVGPIGFHQDHHHWFHSNPVNLAERENGYIQILYYPNGFTRGDRSLTLIPGSHRVSPLPGVTPERLLAGEFNEEAGRELAAEHLELPPGSLVYLNARTFHAVQPKPLDSPQPFRVFNIDIFKQAGPPHRYTQEIPPEWLANATPARQRMFQREPYTPEGWTCPATPASLPTIPVSQVTGALNPTSI